MRRKSPNEIKPATRDLQKKRTASPTLASLRPKRKNAEHSPSFRYDREVTDKFDTSGSSRPSSNTPPETRPKRSKAAESKAAEKTQSSESQSPRKRTRSAKSPEDAERSSNDETEVEQNGQVAQQNVRRSAKKSEAVGEVKVAEPTSSKKRGRASKLNEEPQISTPVEERPEEIAQKPAKRSTKKSSEASKVDSPRLEKPESPEPKPSKKRGRSEKATEEHAENVQSPGSEAHGEKSSKDAETTSTPVVETKSPKQETTTKRGRSKKSAEEPKNSEVRQNPSEESAQNVTRTTRKSAPVVDGSPVLKEEEVTKPGIVNEEPNAGTSITAVAASEPGKESQGNDGVEKQLKKSSLQKTSSEVHSPETQKRKGRTPRSLNVRQDQSEEVGQSTTVIDGSPVSKGKEVDGLRQEPNAETSVPAGVSASEPGKEDLESGKTEKQLKKSPLQKTGSEIRSPEEQKQKGRTRPETQEQNANTVMVDYKNEAPDNSLVAVSGEKPVSEEGKASELPTGEQPNGQEMVEKGQGCSAMSEIPRHEVGQSDVEPQKEKAQLPQPSTELQSPGHKGRGRPKKSLLSPQQSEVPDEEAVVHKGRGRPRKSRLLSQESDQSEDESANERLDEQPIVKKGRGRPKKVLSQESDLSEDESATEQLDEQPIVKKGRGRPKKVLSQESDLSEDESATEQLDEQPIVKMGRGRPKKVLSQESEQPEKEPDLSDEQTVVVQRGRGRPRKPLVLYDESEQSEEEPEQSNEQPVVPLGRLRPKSAQVSFREIDSSSTSNEEGGNQHDFSDGDRLFDGRTVGELETQRLEDGYLTCPRCKTNYISAAWYFVKHVKKCHGERRRPGRKSLKSDTSQTEEDEAAAPAVFVEPEFPPPQKGSCKLCKDAAPFDDIFRHYATDHCALYLPESDDYRRDGKSFDEVLRLTGKLTCQYCGRQFKKSGFGLVIHETRCPQNPKYAFEGDANSQDAVDGNVNTLIDGRTMAELEETYTNTGALTCSRCNSEFTSPVRYFVKHARSCRKMAVSSESEGEVPMKLEEFPDSMKIPGNCVFCPSTQPPVEDMFRHYAIEHSILYTEQEPGWSRSAEALDTVLRYTGKVVCQFCQRIFRKTGLGLLIHEARCPSKPHLRSPVKVASAATVTTTLELDDLGISVDSGSSGEESASTVDGLTQEDLERMKERDGYLTCPRCSVDYHSPVLYFIKHYHSCTGKARKVPAQMLQGISNGEHCGDPPYQCQICVPVIPFETAVLMQNHYMQTHIALYAPDFPEGVRTAKVRELILKKFGKLDCPKCGASYRLVASFQYHEKSCFAGDKIHSFLRAPLIAKKVDKVLPGPVKCTLCSDGKTLEPEAVQKHYMEEHCAIYDPEGGIKCVLEETNDSLYFIMQRVGYLRCEKCSNQYRSPLWYFRRHRETCGCEVPADSSKTESSNESDAEGKGPGKRKRRQAATRALRRIGRMADSSISVKDEDSKDTNFEEEIKKELAEEETSSSEGNSDDDDDTSVVSERSDRNERSANKTPVPGVVLRASTFFVRNIREWPLRKVINEVNDKFRQRFAPSEDGRPFAPPSRLSRLKPDLDLWTIEKSENYLQSDGATVSFRFESDADNQTHVLFCLTGKTSSSEAQNEAVFFVGGRVFAFDSAPLRQNGDGKDVFYAISASSNQDPDTRISTLQPSAVQVWHVPVEKTTQRFGSPQLAYSLAVDSGPVLALQFCPVAPENENCVGFLAIGGNAPNLISIVALPSPEDVAQKNSQTAPLFRPSFSLQLQLHNSNNEGSDRSFSPELTAESVHPRRTISLDWSLDGALLVAALSDATVAVWNFESQSPLFSLGGSSSLLAARTFRAHSQPLACVRISPFTKKAIITLSIDGALSLFDAASGNLLNSIMFPYSTHLALMSGSSLPIIVNNPWFVYRRTVPPTSQTGETVTPKKESKEGSSPQKSVPIVSSLSVIDLFGDSPASDTWPFRPVSSGGSISCISSVKPMFPPCKPSAKDGKGEPPKSMMALGFATGNTSGDVTLYTTTAYLLKIRGRALEFNYSSEKIVCSSRLLNDKSVIELRSSRAESNSDETQERNDDPIAVAVAPPAKNAINLVNVLQFPGDEIASFKHANPRVMIASAMTCGLVRILFADCASTSQVTAKKTRQPHTRRKLANTGDAISGEV